MLADPPSLRRSRLSACLRILLLLPLLSGCLLSGLFAATTPKPSRPKFTLKLQSLVVAEGADATFSILASGTDPLAYEWHKDGTPIEGATGPVLQIPGAEVSDAGSYSVRVSNSLGAITSKQATLSVLIPPGLLSWPGSKSVIVGRAVRLAITPTGSAPLKYQWRKDGVDLKGQTKPELLIKKIGLGHAGEYTVRVSNAVGTVFSEPATLTVLEPRIALGLSGTWATIQQGASGTVTVTVTRSDEYWGPVALSISKLPSGVEGTFEPAVIPVGSTTSVLTISASSSAPAKTSKSMIKATAPGVADALAEFPVTVTEVGSEVATYRAEQPWDATWNVGMLQGAKEGVYLETWTLGSEQEIWKWDGIWRSWVPDEYVMDWRPGAPYHEIPEEFNVAWTSIERFGSWFMNNGLPSLSWANDLIPLDYPGGTASGRLNVYIPSQYQWGIGDGAIFGDTHHGGGAATRFEFITNIPEPDVVIEDPDPTKVTLYVGIGNSLHVVTPFDVESYDLSSFELDPAMIAAGRVQKLVCAADRLWIGYNGKILTFKDGSLSLFHHPAPSINDIMPWGSFCVTAGQVYTADGMRYPIGGGPGVPFLASNPDALVSKPAEFLNYLQLKAVIGGGIECRRDSLDPTIYVISGLDGKLYIIDPL
jgi:hypothetical protein